MNDSSILPGAGQLIELSGQTDHPDHPYQFIDAPFADSLWHMLELLYASVYSSRVLLEPLCRHEPRSGVTRAWVERTDGKISTLLLFTQEGPLIRVLNEVLTLPVSVINRFASAIFVNHPGAHLVQLHAIVLHRDQTHPRMWCSAFSEDYVLDLPAQRDAWFSSLSRHSREKMRYYLRRGFRLQPEMQFTATFGADIVEDEVKIVLRQNRQRMEHKGKTFSMSDAEGVQICRQMQQVGILFALRLKGQICAGLLCSLTGRDLYVHVIAHDPAHNELRPGLLCCCLAIQHAIELRLARFHFLWGHYDYKRRLGARAKPLHRLLVPRTAGHLFRHPVHLSRWVAAITRDAARRWRRPALAGEMSC